VPVRTQQHKVNPLKAPAKPVVRKPNLELEDEEITVPIEQVPIPKHLVDSPVAVEKWKVFSHLLQKNGLLTTGAIEYLEVLCLQYHLISLYRSEVAKAPLISVRGVLKQNPCAGELSKNISILRAMLIDIGAIKRPSTQLRLVPNSGEEKPGSVKSRKGVDLDADIGEFLGELAGVVEMDDELT